MTLPPGPRMPAVMQTLWWMIRPIESFEQDFRKYGDIYTIKNAVFGTEVVVSHPESIKQVFTGDPEVWRAGEAVPALRSFVGESSVLMLDGAAHVRQRRLLLPPLHGERMYLYAEAIRSITEAEMAKWVLGKPMPMLPSMQRIALEVILRVVFGMHEGVRLDSLRNELEMLLNTLASPRGMMWLHPKLSRDFGSLTPWSRIKSGMERADSLITLQIERCREDPALDKRTDVLSMLLRAKDESGQAMTDAEIRDELVTLLAAGYDTTATALCWAIEQIALNPDAEARALEEIHEVTGESQLQPAHLSKLPYLDATIREALRLRPVVPLVARRLKAAVTIRGYEIPAETLVVPCIYLTHRLPDVYPEPGRFLPERFLDKKPDPYSWLPFGGGMRRCIGMALALYEMKVVLAAVLPQMRFKLAGRTPTRVSLRSFALGPEKGLPVLIERRSSGTRDA